MKTLLLSNEDNNFIARALRQRAEKLGDLGTVTGSRAARDSIERGIARHEELAKMFSGAELVLDSGAALVSEERARQIEQEGWTPEHDDRHVGGELLQAALYWLRPGDFAWPWGEPPKSHAREAGRVRHLTIAAALIAAEIDRMLREDVAKGA